MDYKFNLDEKNNSKKNGLRVRARIPTPRVIGVKVVTGFTGKGWERQIGKCCGSVRTFPVLNETLNELSLRRGNIYILAI